MTRVLVAGIDSSTQSCKVTVRDAVTGTVLRHGSAPHPPRTIVDPESWWSALLAATAAAGGLDDVASVSVSGQQHTPVFLDAAGDVVVDSPLWNDIGSHVHLMDLNRELSPDEWIRRTGMPLAVSDTVTKVRELRVDAPELARRTAAVCLVHDWLTWRLLGGQDAPGGLSALVTDRSEASGTAYWSPETGEYCDDLFIHAFGRRAELPRVLGPLEIAGSTAAGIPGIPAGIPVAAGAGDNAAAALALELDRGDAVMSLGTSGVVYTPSDAPVHDLAGNLCSYADATGGFIPLIATMNAARNFDAAAAVLRCDHHELSDLALAALPGAGGLTLVPYFEGERTPNLPHARGAFFGASLANMSAENMARAVVEGTMAAQVHLLNLLVDSGQQVDRLILIGGAGRNPAVRDVLARMVDVPIDVPADDEYVSRGAAIQAAAILSGQFPQWPLPRQRIPAQPHHPELMASHLAAREHVGSVPEFPATPKQRKEL